jgi:hypothetical protein
LARVAIDHAADDERPHHQVRAKHARDRRNRRPAVHDAADIRENGCEADDRGRERGAEARRLRHELLPPVIVHAVGGVVRGKARAQVILQHAAKGERQRNGHGERHRKHADEYCRCACGSPEAVEEARDDHAKNP